LREKGVIKVPGLDVVFEGQKFGTPSGRLEFYVEKPHPRNDFGQSWDVDRERLPRWVPPTEAWPDNPLYGKYPLVVITPKSRFRVHGQWFGVPWLRELDPEPIVTMNPQDAGARGIANGDYVEVFNDRGHVVLKAVVSHGVRPGVLSIPKGWQRHQFKAGGYQELTSGSFDPVGVNASFYETLAEVRQWNEEV
jgi:molybdopterin-containing oxidoreductase family molybdopterin binding subunit